MVNIAEMYREFEKDNLDTINCLHIECGAMRSLIERFPGDNPDGHLKIPHLWPGQNPPATER